MQRDARAPAVAGRPDHQRPRQNQHGEAQPTMRTHDSEIDQDDHRGDGQPIADDGERPCITGITYEDQIAVRTALELGPPGKQRPLSAVWAALAQSTPKRRTD
jgi:hypothetical protein